MYRLFRGLDKYGIKEHPHIRVKIRISPTACSTPVNYKNNPAVEKICVKSTCSNKKNTHTTNNGLRYQTRECLGLGTRFQACIVFNMVYLQGTRQKLTK